MDTKELYREILNEHNLNPSHKAPMQDATMSLNGVNPSCGDNITLNLKIKDGIITDGSFTGQGCAVSQASCDMMLDISIGSRTLKRNLYEHDKRFCLRNRNRTTR